MLLHRALSSTPNVQAQWQICHYAVNSWVTSRRVCADSCFLFNDAVSTAEDTQNKKNYTHQELKFGKYLLIFGIKRLPPAFDSLASALRVGSYFQYNLSIQTSRDSAVGTATGYRLNDRGVGVRISVGSRILFSKSSKLAVSTGGSFPGCKTAGA
jgi:hypothetical protein